jgi:autoinducer 2-degrading protein
MYVVIVKFSIEPQRALDFRDMVAANAAESLAVEQGCHVFDICEMADGDFWLYEVYDDAGAFAAHLQTSHFLQFNEATTPWVLDQRCHIPEPAAAGLYCR